MKVLVWQWGRRGAGPRFAACLAEALRGRSGLEVTLSLCHNAEIMTGHTPPQCELAVSTYRGAISLLLRLLSAPFALIALLHRLSRIAPDLVICAMPGPLDLLMAAALRILGTRLLVVVHDADLHPGDGFPGQMWLQRLLCRNAHGLAALCRHVAERLRQQGLVGSGQRPLILFEHPPFAFDLPLEQHQSDWNSRVDKVARESNGLDRADCSSQPESGLVKRADNRRRLLCFGRLLPYKGLDMLADALASLPIDHSLQVRVVGNGPETVALTALRALPHVTVENRWVPETEIGALLAWSDALILPYREASQSGVAAAALAAGRPVIATRVGGLREQLSEAPQAVMCEPDAASLARAIALWLDSPKQITPPANAQEAWRDAVSDLLDAIGNAGLLTSRNGSRAGRTAPGGGASFGSDRRLTTTEAARQCRLQPAIPMARFPFVLPTPLRPSLKPSPRLEPDKPALLQQVEL